MISIIIVSKDNEDGIAKTLKSIVCKGTTPFEVIIKRFSLCDTVERTRNTTEISGPDNGIYDAMNIATKYVNFNWICYMNAGDRFACSLDRLMVVISQNTDKQIIYGDTLVDGIYARKALSVRYLRLGSAFCHQSTIIRSDVTKKGYNVQYRYAADYDLFNSIFTSSKSFKKLNLTISNIESGGVSDINRTAVYREWRDIQKHYFKYALFSSTLYFVRILREYARSFIS